MQYFDNLEMDLPNLVPATLGFLATVWAKLWNDILRGFAVLVGILVSHRHSVLAAGLPNCWNEKRAVYEFNGNLM